MYDLRDFQCYKKLVLKWMEKDAREIVYQTNILLPFLSQLLDDLDIVDVSTQYKNRNTKRHNRNQYAGEYTPDIVVVSNWNYTKNNCILAVIEVKSPCLDPIYRKEQLSKHTTNEIECYNQLESNPTVILTDCIQWRFFENGKENCEKRVNLPVLEDSMAELTQWNNLKLHLLALQKHKA